MNSATPESALTVALVVALVITGWLAVGALLSAISRWPVLAQRYPGGRRPASRRLRGQVYGVGVMPESNVTGLVPTPAGLYLYSHPLFRFRRPPVLLPWATLRHVRAHQLLWRRWHTLDLAGVTTLRVSERAWRAIAPQIPPAGSALLPNVALQLSGTPGTSGAPAASVVRDRQRAGKTRS